MGFSFDPKDPKHQQGNFIQEPGRYVVEIVAFHRWQTRKSEQAFVAHCKVLLGPKTGAELTRMFMLEGRGTGWTADLFNAVGCNSIQDVMNDVEMSLALGHRPFAAQCDWGDPVPGKTRKGTNEPMRYMELHNALPIDNAEQSELQRNNYRPGIQPGTSILVDPPEKKSQSTNAGPRDDVPHPADMADQEQQGGPQQGGGWGGPPPPDDDDIPF